MEDVNYAEILRVRASGDENCALRRENAELRELATMVVNLSKVSDVPISISSKAKQLLNK